MRPATPGHPSTSRSTADVASTVLVDLYGTLVDPDWPELLKGRTALAERAGVAPAAASRGWDETHAARMVGAHGSLPGDLAAVFAAASDGGPAPISRALLDHLADDERENWRRGVRLHPDALPALGLLRSLGVRLAIVTNASAEAAGVIDQLSLRPMVDGVFASCEIGVLKPALLAVACYSLDVDAVDATLVDDEPEQLERAAELGIGTILVQRSGTTAPRRSGAGDHPVVTDLRQLAELVGGAEPARQR